MIYEPIQISCPDCKKMALFEEPFEFLNGKPECVTDNKNVHQWGGWYVRERFPTQFPWKPPSSSQQYVRGGGGKGDGYPLLQYGQILCSNCHTNRKHRLNWPLDAYWSWEIRGEILWAWDRNHAESILEFARQRLRPTRWNSRLRYIPSVFLSAKVRPEVCKKIESSLEQRS